MDREQCFKILKSAEVGPKTIRILRAFWERLELRSTQGKWLLGTSYQGLDGGDPRGSLLPTIFNLMVDAITRE